MDELDQPTIAYLRMNYNFSLLRIGGCHVESTRFSLKMDLLADGDDAESLTEDLSEISYRLECFFTNVVDRSVVINPLDTWATEAFVHNPHGRTANNLIIVPASDAEGMITALLMSKVMVLVGDSYSVMSMELENLDSNITTAIVGSNPTLGLPETSSWLGTDAFYSLPWWSRYDFTTMDSVRGEGNENRILPEWHDPVVNLYPVEVDEDGSNVVSIFAKSE